ncbi:MAG: NAD/NADP octopine/nopaline dehydrogenase family protein [Dialister invisus]
MPWKSARHPPVPLLEVLNSFWPEKKNTLKEALKENPSYRAVKGPSSTEYRYFTEDLPCGLGPVLDLAELMHIPRPYIRTLVQTASSTWESPTRPSSRKKTCGF